MMKMVLASRNEHKIRELQAILREYLEDVEILSLDDVGIIGEIEENGSSFEENAEIKARAAAASGEIGIGDDSGLSVRALGGAPGIYSARYAGEHGNDAANNERLLREMKGVEDRYGEFVCAICCVFPNGDVIRVRGVTGGLILEELLGEGGFGYDPLFYVPEMKKTFAEMTAREKNSISHRGRAIALLVEQLKQKNEKR